MDFSTFGLSDRLLRGIQAGGLRVPTPFQSLLLQASIDGRNVVALTPPVPEVIAALALPVLHRCEALAPVDRQDRSPRVLIITTNRDRARNLQRGALSYGRFLSLRTVALYGGVTVESQLPLIQQGAEILVATPDRLIEHIEKGTVGLAGIGFVVIDEADGLIGGDPGNQLGEILVHLAGPRQTFVVAAEVTDQLRAFIGERVPDPVEIRREGPVHQPEAGRVSRPHHGSKGRGSGTSSHRGGHPAGRRSPSKPGGGVYRGENQDRGGVKHSGQPLHSGHPTSTGNPARYPATGQTARHASAGSSARHTSSGRPARHTSTGSSARHASTGNPTRHASSGHPGRSGPGVYPARATSTGLSGRPGSAGHPTKGKKKVRKPGISTMTAPRKKRPPKRLDSFSSDRGGAGW